MTAAAGHPDVRAGAQPAPRSAALDPDSDRVFQDLRARRARRLGGRDIRASLTIATAFLAVAVPMAVFPSDRSPSTLAIVALVAAYALAFRVKFEIGTGSAVPTQLVFVPMLFMLPAGIVPLCVAGAIALASLPEHLRRALSPDRALLHLVNAGHALGPALVLAFAGEPELSWGSAPIFAAALAAQFGLDFAMSGARTRFGLGISARAQLRFMGWSYLVDAGLAPLGLLVAAVAVNDMAALLAALPLVGLLAVFARERRGRIDQALELSQAYRGTAFLLGDVVEADDAYTGRHSREVVSLVLRVADELGLRGRERRDAEFAALLHDVGKIRVPRDILNKPGPLTPDEREVMKRHTVEGEQMLGTVGGLLAEVGRIVRACHERFDGKGYPDGLVGDQAPFSARIVACCDAFSAMTSDRPYRPAMPVVEAIAELRRNAGTQFDPTVVEALLAVITERPGAAAA